MVLANMDRVERQTVWSVRLMCVRCLAMAPAAAGHRQTFDIV
ncbi:hypothetical protein MM1S1540310_4467 [Mycobacteroides abscessus subsp. bolletii 1S-154-0310]|nr:hypothetical protein MM1S1510930_4913 [Mycobacteroides abscessus subsp. bolletii 1S-151-0930]EIU71662.1 hypothetical protein MM1S1530915_4462 [Mycobacteroides abscessus subsp. bolletii 1S-153-0915]EIU76546.1 hypothetical protein MM1S1540310_4467 [Mycobacteroides abscessus subsp. bolletii 1S-154-0310]EIU79056.1 hypothetical protein MM2B0626_4681 [Mycobacteroides abscessus subsp. bolletii 2B-0626]EIV16950.1 hypothetical protein MM2B0912R_0131 [Mycobacteroides abscessus subsp. bolletii 2B-0912-